MSVSEHAVFACEFAGGGGNKRRSGGRKSSVSVWISASEFALYTDKQDFILFSVHPFQTDALLMHMPG